jgi:hypothetical protein
VLAVNSNGIIFPADELSGWARSMGQYKGGRGDDRQHWLSIWSGQQIVSNRKNADPLVINEPFVSVTGGIQPDALSDMIDDGREDGFAARFLFAYPDPIPNREWTDDVIGQSIEYQGICESLWMMEPTNEPLRLTPLAKNLWVTWVNKHRRDTPPDNLRPTWSKAEGNCARLALVLCMTRRVCNTTSRDAIDHQSMSGAVKLIEYFKSHARRVYGRATDHKDKGRIGNALRWIRKHGGVVTARKANMYGLCENSDEAKQLFNDLVELGFGTVAKLPRNSVEFRIADIPTEHNASTSQRDNATEQ